MPINHVLKRFFVQSYNMTTQALKPYKQPPRNPVSTPKSKLNPKTMLKKTPQQPKDYSSFLCFF